MATAKIPTLSAGPQGSGENQPLVAHESVEFAKLHIVLKE